MYRGSAQLQELRSLVNPSELSSARKPWVQIHARYFSQRRHNLGFNVELQPVDARNDAHRFTLHSSKHVGSSSKGVVQLSGMTLAGQA